MQNLRSVEEISKTHTFERDMSSIPITEWMNPRETRSYEEVLKQKVEELEILDKDIETIISNPDENMRIALGDANYLEKEIRVSELKFPSYLPQGKVQIQRDLIRKLSNIAKVKNPPLKDVNQEIGAIRFQSEWEVNPKIGTVSIDGNESVLMLKDSLKLFKNYLNACEHEFYKQSINAQFDRILHYYGMTLESAEFRGEKAKSQLLKSRDAFYSHPVDLLDRIYYSRARDFLSECDVVWSFLDGNEYTKKYLIRMEDIHPKLKKEK